MLDKLNLIIVFVLVVVTTKTFSQNAVLNSSPRKIKSLNGAWQYIVDPYETGFYNYRFQERREDDREAYWNSDVPENKSDRKEHGYNDDQIIRVPGDWNSQDKKFLYYEGTLWYKKTFDYQKAKKTNRVFLYFGAVNYKADVYLNGKKLGTHKGGFTPFHFEVTDDVLKANDNFLVVKVDNKRYADEVPTLNTDWWNYGGITRDVSIVEFPDEYISDYAMTLDPEDKKRSHIKGWVQLNGPLHDELITIEIPALKLKQTIKVTNGKTDFDLHAKNLELWSPANPRIYEVTISTAHDKINDRIGFRSIAVSGTQVLLNGQPVFLRSICIHEEIPEEGRRAYSRQDAVKLLSWAKEADCNMVRLAHYPHNENMLKVADSLGLMVWAEIPVYWTIDFKNQQVFEKAKLQLDEMIERDKNRASIIVWSVGNETPVTEARTNFMKGLLLAAREMDSTRLVTAALEVNYTKMKNMIDDPLGQYVDLVAVNEYIGWYSGLPADCEKAKWEIIYDKPLFFSETGAEAVEGFHADSLTRWSEEYQAFYFQQQIAMMKRMPKNFVGFSPWILADFRSPRRNNPTYQAGWNNKGIISQKGEKKKAFYLLKNYYDDMKLRYE
jgi:beta-glucuronidase